MRNIIAASLFLGVAFASTEPFADGFSGAKRPLIQMADEVSGAKRPLIQMADGSIGTKHALVA